MIHFRKEYPLDGPDPIKKLARVAQGPEAHVITGARALPMTEGPPRGACVDPVKPGPGAAGRGFSHGFWMVCGGFVVWFVVGFLAAVKRSLRAICQA